MTYGAYGVKQTRRFARQYKKLQKKVAYDVDGAIEIIASTPTIGERKKGDLADFLVHKWDTTPTDMRNREKKKLTLR